MSTPESFLGAKYALLHGDDAEGRVRAVSAWRARHVDPEWEDFSLLVCPEGCQWPVVLNALLETAPLGADRVVIVPHADNLFDRTKDLPPTIRDIMVKPIDGTRLLFVARNPLSEEKGRILASKPFSDWKKEGRVLKLGALDVRDAANFIESKAKTLKLMLASGVARTIAERMGGNPGVLTRALEVIDLMSDGQPISAKMVDDATFRIGEQNAFAWSQAWQNGRLAEALKCLRVAIEDDAGTAPILLLGQARKEVERLCRLYEAKKGNKAISQEELAKVLELTPKQGFVLDRCERVLTRIHVSGLKKLVTLLAETDSDVKGGALNQSATPLVDLTVQLCKVWGYS